MHVINEVERLKKMNSLIEKEQTGTPDELAAKLNISRSKLYELIKEFRSIGKSICYKRSIQSFCYEDDQKLNIIFSMELLSSHDYEKINGGSIFSSSELFSGRNAHILV